MKINKKKYLIVFFYFFNYYFIILLQSKCLYDITAKFLKKSYIPTHTPSPLTHISIQDIY